MECRLDDFDILETLGEGAAGTVYRVRPKDHLASEFPASCYALKRFKPWVLSDTTGLSRLTREATMLTRLRHPYIIQYVRFVIDGNDSFILMEHFAGCDLTKISVPPESVASIVLQLAEAISYLHAHGVHHRDIKPENVLYDGGIAKLCDFGVARAFEDGTLTRTHQFLGTIRYAAPEYLFHNEYYDSSDYFGLGHILFYLVEGSPLIQPQQSFALQVQQVSELKPPMLRGPIANRPLVNVVTSRLLAQEPTSRYANLDLVKAVLALPELSRPVDEIATEYCKLRGVVTHLRLPTMLEVVSQAPSVVQAFEIEARNTLAYALRTLPVRLKDHPLRTEAAAVAAAHPSAFATEIAIAITYSCLLRDAGRIEVLEEMVGLRLDEYTLYSPSADQYVLDLKTKVLLVFLTSVEHDKAVRQVLIRAITQDSSARSAIRDAFIDNGDPDDDDAYTFTYALNDALVARSHRDHADCEVLVRWES